MPLAVVVAGVLWGSVTIGPLTPVCKMGTPCSGPAKHVTLTFTRLAKPSRVISTKTDSNGRYRVTLPKGIWSVRASAGMRITPSSVPVRAGVHRVGFGIDTGIR
jgi:hypothetical protein